MAWLLHWKVGKTWKENTSSRAAMESAVSWGSDRTNTSLRAAGAEPSPSGSVVSGSSSGLSSNFECHHVRTASRTVVSRPLGRRPMAGPPGNVLSGVGCRGPEPRDGIRTRGLGS